jgi:hypothetical protein
MDINQIKFRASSMSDIMTGVAKQWPVEKSLTCQRRLVKMYREHVWGRKDSKGNQYTEKGTKVEPDSITLYSRVKKEMYKKNDMRLEDDWFSGELDLYTGESITTAETVIDIKSSWDWTTFPSFLDSDNKDYYAQIQTYLSLTGAKKGVIAYCLVNTPAEMILDIKKRLQWQIQVIDPENDLDFKKACMEVEKNNIYDRALFESHYPYFDFDYPKSEWSFDIPNRERVLEIEYERDDVFIEIMRQRVQACRIWMAQHLF